MTRDSTHEPNASASMPKLLSNQSLPVLTSLARAQLLLSTASQQRRRLLSRRSGTRLEAQRPADLPPLSQHGLHTLSGLTHAEDKCGRHYPEPQVLREATFWRDRQRRLVSKANHSVSGRKSRVEIQSGHTRQWSGSAQMARGFDD